MDGIILAAGSAVRLLPLTAQRPKAMLFVGGKPIVQHALESLHSLGAQRAVVVLGRNAEPVQDFLGDGEAFGLKVEYVQQGEPTGTAAAVRCALPLLDPKAGVWVVPANAFISPGSLTALRRTKGDTLVVSSPLRDHPQFVPRVRGTQLAGGSWERPDSSALVSTGIMALGADTARWLETTDTPRLEDALVSRAADHTVQARRMEGQWLTIVDPWDLLAASEQALRLLPTKGPKPKVASVTGAMRLGRNTSIAETATLIGPVTIGDGSSIGDRSVVGPYVSIRNNSVIGTHCEVRHSILNDNVVLDSRSVLRGSILDDGVQVGPGFLCADEATGPGPRGCILGADARVGTGARAEPGAILQPEGSVPAGGVVQAEAPRRP